MTSAQQQATLAGANCEIAFDNLTRQLYATDASIYQVEPVAVAFPRSTRQASALIIAAMQAGIAVIPRGAGTGLAGGAIGDGLVVDFSRHNRLISDLDLDRRTVRVGPGVVLDQLNHFLRPHGFCFGPDVATSSRATLGGMIANNSSGAHTPAYGTTADHITELELVLWDGQVVMVGPGHDTLRRQRELLEDLVYFHSLTIQEHMPPGLLKRWAGYALDRCRLAPRNLNHLLCGSEGTLAAITSAELNIVPLPPQKGLALIFFDSLAEAMQATVQLLDLHPAAIEHIDRLLLDQTRGQREFQPARDLLQLDAHPCASLLLVEFFDDVQDRLRSLERRHLGSRCTLLTDPQPQALVWALRKAGLSLLTGCKGDAKPVTGIEDAAVRVQDLPLYVAELEKIMHRLGLQASYYGHAAAGLLHVRPLIDLHTRQGLKLFRQLSTEVSDLVRHFKGSFAAEHGVGIARTELLHLHLGEPLAGVMREIKAAFDPHNLFNPGKIVSDGRYDLDDNLRLGPAHHLGLPFTPVLAFAEKDGSFRQNLEQCNGCGACRKETPSMCPTFIVTGEEWLSTRGRANAIRAALDGRAPNSDILRSPELHAALDSCLACKACTSECPSNVNLALLKTELLHARIRRDGLSLRERLFSSVDLLGPLGTAFPRLANAAMDSLLVRSLLAKTLGIAWQRPLPHFASQRFDRWFARHSPPPAPPHRGPVLLWDDTFVRYHEPHIGAAAVRVLEAAGFQVRLLHGRKCCGRPAFSQGHLDRAAALARHNLDLLARLPPDIPLLFLEPSCFSMVVQDYRELNLQLPPGLTQRSFLFEQFLELLLTREPGALPFTHSHANLVIHAHCHLKSLLNPDFLLRLASRLPGRNVSLLNSACCGMAGAFGAIAHNYPLSLKVAEPLALKIRALPYGSAVVASGTSCRHQIAHLAPVRPRHMAELLADALQGEG